MTIALDQTASVAIESTSTNQNISFQALPTTGSRVIVIGERYGATTASPLSASDNQSGNTYTTEVSTGHNNADNWLLDVASITAPSGTFTVTASCPSDYNVYLMSFKDTTAYNSTPYATTGGTVSSSFAASITAAAATTVANSLCLAVMGMDSFGTSPGWSTPSGFTNSTILNGASGRLFRVDYQILTSTQTITANWGSSLTGQGSTGSWEAALYFFTGTAVSVTQLMGGMCL